MKIGNREFGGRTYIMGILNITPDSFCDGGKYNALDSALKHTEEMIKDGADIIDIGGESTRPGYTPVSAEEEMERIVPVIEKISSEFDIPLSVDTYKAAVAREALNSGADMLNDIWGFSDNKMAELAAEYNTPCCLMHNRKEPIYGDFIADVIWELRQSIDRAVSAGLDRDKIIIDPGVGFGKTYEQNLEVMRRLDELKVLDCPILLGASGKSVIGITLDLPVSQRLSGTLATSVIAVLKGAEFIRVHNVRENKRAVLMAEKILGRW